MDQRQASKFVRMHVANYMSAHLTDFDQELLDVPDESVRLLIKQALENLIDDLRRSAEEA